MAILYLTIALRNLIRKKLYTSINIIGFAFGLSCSFLIFLYVAQELTFDRHFDSSDRIYRVGTSFMNMGEFAVSQEQLAENLRLSSTDIEETARIGSDSPLPVRSQMQGAEVDETLEKNVYYADSTVFKLFSFKFLEGEAKNALNTPNKVVISESTARKYFGTSKALGKTLFISKQNSAFVVSGVLRDPPLKSHLQAALWLPIYPQISGNSEWFSASVYTYLRVREGVSLTRLNQHIQNFTKRVVYPTASFGLSFEKWLQDERGVKFLVTPLHDIHLFSAAKFPLSPGGSSSTVFALACIGCVLLLLIIVNYTNLTIAQSTVRAKEIGIKKTLGASKKQIAIQFWGESILITGFAALLAVVFSELMLHIFRQTLEVEFVESIFVGKGLLLFFLGGFALLVGLVAGMYPAIYLARLQPAMITKGDVNSQGKPRVRNTLVVFQFVLATVMMICSLFVVQQMNFMQNKDVGLQRDNVLIIEEAGRLQSKIDALKGELTKIPGVLNVSTAERVPATSMISRSTYKTLEMTEPLSVNVFNTDAEFFSTLGIRLSSGRFFQKNLASDSSSAILNESAVRVLGLKNPVGSLLYHGDKTITVVGVIQDFHFESLKKSVEPVIMRQGGKPNFIVLRVQSSDQAVLSSVQKIWKQFSPEEPLKYTYLEDAFEKFLRKEKVLLRLGIFFTIVCTVISTLGLFGLSSFLIYRREKEMGIRKILGASTSKIVEVLSTEFIRLVIIACLVACPVAWWLMNKWLQDFAYRIDLNVGAFVIAGLVAVTIAGLTVSFTAMKVANQNPVKALRNE